MIQPEPTDEPISAREVVITRVIDAPARFVFAAHTTPDHVKRWFGPVGWPLTLCEIDFRVGGRFRFGMTGPDGTPETPFGGTYLEIVPNRKIVYDNGFEEPGAEKMVVTITFVEQSGKTALTVHTLFPSAAMRDEYVGVGFAEGVNSGLDQLVEVVAEMRRENGS